MARFPEDVSDFDARRREMVERQLIARGIRDPAVLRAFLTVPREEFVPPAAVGQAYADGALSIGQGQTISQPYIVARMTQELELKEGDRVLEIGAGSGYGAAILAEIAGEVFTVERVEELAQDAARRLERLGREGVHVRVGDGTLGWPEHAPYDAISVTAGGPRVPPSLLEQLAIGGRLIMPVGMGQPQRLVKVRRTGEDAFETVELEPVSFVPLVGREGWEPEP